MSKRDEAKRILEEAMRKSGTNPFADIAQEFGAAEGRSIFDEVARKVADRLHDSEDRVIGDRFTAIAMEARALRERMEGIKPS